MRWVAMASARVTVGSSPSGTFATMMPDGEDEVLPEGKADHLTDDEEPDTQPRGERRYQAAQMGDLSLQW
jgi:hypothetical protein